MESILRARQELRDREISRAKDWAAKLPFRASVFLIGSYARGDFNLWSDLDLVVICQLKGPPLQRLAEIDPLPGSQPIPLTPQEFVRLTRMRHPIAVEALTCGVALRDDFGIRERASGQVS